MKELLIGWQNVGITFDDGFQISDGQIFPNINRQQVLINNTGRCGNGDGNVPIHEDQPGGGDLGFLGEADILRRDLLGNS